MIPTTDATKRYEGDTLTVVFNMFVHILFSGEDLVDGSKKGLQRQNQNQLFDLWLMKFWPVNNAECLCDEIRKLGHTLL